MGKLTLFLISIFSSNFILWFLISIILSCSLIIFSYESIISFKWLILSSFSFKLLVKVSIVSFCLLSKSLYESTCSFDIWINSFSFSKSFNFSLKSFCSKIWCFCSNVLNSGVSSIFTFWPPGIIWNFIISIFFSNFLFSSLSCKNLKLAFSNACNASFLSFSACNFSISIFLINALLLIIWFFSSNSFLNLFNSVSYWDINALWFTSSLILALILIHFALFAKLRVDKLSLKLPS